MKKEETLREFASRIANETGFDDSPQTQDWIDIKIKYIEEATQAFCHYKNGGGGVNSCCRDSYRCRDAIEAASKIRFGDKNV